MSQPAIRCRQCEGPAPQPAPRGAPAGAPPRPPGWNPGRSALSGSETRRSPPRCSTHQRRPAVSSGDPWPPNRGDATASGTDAHDLIAGDAHSQQSGDGVDDRLMPEAARKPEHVRERRELTISAAVLARPGTGLSVATRTPHNAPSPRASISSRRACSKPTASTRRSIMGRYCLPRK